jgi:hypothetical protein
MNKLNCKLTVIGIVFLLGFYYIYRTNDIEAFNTNGKSKITKNCPDVLIQKGSAFFLYNSQRTNVPGVNPIRFENLEEYTEFTEWQRSQGILCPILYLQHAYNAQGDAVYKAHPSPTNMQSGLPDYYVMPEFAMNNNNLMPPPANVPVNGYGAMPAEIAPVNSYLGFDPHNQDIGVETPLDKMYNDTANQFSANPMDDNWGGIKYTETLVESGYYSGNEVSKVTL